MLNWLLNRIRKEDKGSGLPEGYKYWAFISYSHQDTKWGDWLYNKLTAYRVPRKIIGRVTEAGKVPQNFKGNVFRDREKLSAGAVLTPDLIEALKRSISLIVVCSSTSAQSSYVNDEIKIFKLEHSDKKIIPLIIEGEPNVSDKPQLKAQECFPDALRYDIDTNGNLTDKRTEYTAADVRKAKDGKQGAFLKIVAGILKIPFADYEYYEKKRLLKQRIIYATLFLFILFAGVLTWDAYQDDKKYQLALEYADKGHKARIEYNWGIALINYKKSLEIADNMFAKIGASHALANFFPEIFQFSAEEPITATCFSHDGKLLAYSHGDTVSILDTQTWSIYKRLKKSKSFGSYDPDEYINSLAFSFDDRKLVAHSGQSIIIWVLDSGIKLNNNIKLNPSFSDRSTNAFSLSPIGDFLISLGSDIHILKHSLHDGKLISEYKGNSPISSLAFSNDGQMFASGCDDGSIQLWDITDKNKSVQLLGHTSPVISMSFHPEESLLASLSSDNELILWDTTTSNIVSKYNTPDKSSNRAVKVAFLQSGRMLLACDSSIHIFDYDVAKMSREYAWRTYHSWMGMADNFTLYHPIAELKYPIGQIDSVSVSPDEQLLVFSSNEFAKLWSTQCLDNIQRNISNNRSVNILSKDGNLIGSGDKNGTVNVRHIYPDNELVVNRDHSYEITALAFSVDNQYVTSGDKDGNIRVLNIETQESNIVGKHGYQIETLLISPNSSFVAAISQNGVLCIWECNTSSLKYKTTLHSHRSLKPMAFSPDERFLIISTDGKLIKIDTFLYSKSEIRIDVEADIHSIAFNSDGELVATGGANTIQLLDTSDWSITNRITGTFPNVNNLVFNNASNILISSSSDSIIRFWNIHNINEVAQIPLSSPVRSMGLSLQDNETEKLVVLCQNGIIYNYALHADRPSLINEMSLYLDVGFPWELNNIGNVKEKASAELARKQLDAANNSLIPWLADKSNSISNLLKLELHKEKARKNRGKLYKALSVGDIDLAKKLIVLDNQQNGNQSYFSFERNSPLYLAVEKGYEDVVDLLVEKRERTHDNDVHDKTVLELAAENNQDSIIKLLLAKGQNILNALFGAMYREDTKTFLKLVEHVTNIDIKTWKGNRLLHLAVMSKNYQAVEYFLKHGFDVDVKGEHWKTPLMYACQYGNQKIADLLLTYGANLEEKDDLGRTPLLLSVIDSSLGSDLSCTRQKQMCEFLINEGGNLRAKDHDGKNILMHAVYSCISSETYHEFLHYLVKRGADPHAKDNDGKNMLMYAAAFKDVRLVKLFLEMGLDINSRDAKGRTPIMFAAENVFGNPKDNVIEFMINNGADINVKDIFGRNLLTYATQNGAKSEFIHLLLTSGLNINESDQFGMTAIMYAAAGGNVLNTVMLIKHGSDINAKDANGMTALMHAALHNKDLDIIKVLLKKNADLQVRNNNGSTTVMLASAQGNIDTAKFFLKGKVAINAKDKQGWSALMTALHFGHDDIVKCLLSKGADIEMKDNVGRTPLMRAILSGNVGNPDVVRFLLDNKAYIDAKDKNGDTPLMHAIRSSAEYDLVTVVSLLVENGADIQAKNKAGWTPLMYAAHFKCLKSAKLLIDKKADVHLKDNRGRTALMCAARSGNIEIAQLLLSNGANIDVKDNQGKTALWYANKFGNEEMSQLLIDGGANTESSE